MVKGLKSCIFFGQVEFFPLGIAHALNSFSVWCCEWFRDGSKQQQQQQQEAKNPNQPTNQPTKQNKNKTQKNCMFD